jgi:tetratricopeptide (TPR) repeat protein
MVSILQEERSMFKKYLIAFSITAVLMLLGSCGGPKERQAESVLDTPEYHYNQGKKYLDKDDLSNALREFNEAKSLKADFAPAYEGIALVQIQQKNFEEAEKNIKKSLSEDGNWVPAVVARGRLYAAQGKYEDAVDEFDDAIDDIDGSKGAFDKKAVKMDALYYKGQAQKEWGQYIPAQTTFQQILEIDNTNVKASAAIKELAEYQAAVAGQSPELQKIAKQKEITRADVAVLFVTELPLEKIFRKSPRQQSISFKAPDGGVMGKKEDKPAGPEMIASDVPQTHWAWSFIDQALGYGIIENFPDGTYKPEEKVNRAEFARLIEHFLVKAWDDRGLETQYFGSTSPFADVLNTSPIFNAVMVVSTRGIMPGMEDGTFQPLNVVSGPEALNVIRNLKAKF